jgi:hypothetical protein
MPCYLLERERVFLGDGKEGREEEDDWKSLQWDCEAQPWPASCLNTKTRITVGEVPMLTIPSPRVCILLHPVPPQSLSSFSQELRPPPHSHSVHYCCRYYLFIFPIFHNGGPSCIHTHTYIFFLPSITPFRSYIFSYFFVLCVFAGFIRSKRDQIVCRNSCFTIFRAL